MLPIDTQTNREIPQLAWGFLSSTVSFTGDTNCPIKGTADEQHFAPGNTNQRPAHKP